MTKLRFDRNEWAGAFGDIGTDLPLVVGMILAAGLDSASVLVMFGAMQALTGLVYRLPMPVQPLKAVAALVITQKIGSETLYGAGLAIGLFMLLLTATGLVDRLAAWIPKPVVRGIQFGLGLKLALLALGEYVPGDGVGGYALAAAAFVVAVALLGNRRFPAALFVIGLGAVYALFSGGLDLGAIGSGVGLRLPEFQTLAAADVWAGFLLLALPQVPLSLGNSVLATHQLAKDYFPQRAPSVRRLGWTYSLMNLVNPFFGGAPTCHGSGGMAGHYVFGARTGGSVVLEGSFYLAAGLFLSGSFSHLIAVFPKPILGVILFFEGLALMVLLRDLAASKTDLFLAVLVGLCAAVLPYGFLVGMLVGTALAYLALSGSRR